jgi:hypothetical protein
MGHAYKGFVLGLGKSESYTYRAGNSPVGSQAMVTINGHRKGNTIICLVLVGVSCPVLVGFGGRCWLSQGVRG